MRKSRGGRTGFRASHSIPRFSQISTPRLVSRTPPLTPNSSLSRSGKQTTEIRPVFAVGNWRYIHLKRPPSRANDLIHLDKSPFGQLFSKNPSNFSSLEKRSDFAQHSITSNFSPHFRHHWQFRRHVIDPRQLTSLQFS